MDTLIKVKNPGRVCCANILGKGINPTTLSPPMVKYKGV